MTPRDQMAALLPRFADPAYRKAFNNAIPVGLCSRRELPSWVQALPDTSERFSIFWGGMADVREYVFTCDRRGVVFRGEYMHTPLEASEVGRMVYALPPDALIAAGVEAKRRMK